MLKYVIASFVLMQTSVGVWPGLQPTARLDCCIICNKGKIGIVHSQETGQDVESHLAVQSSSCLLNVLSVAAPAALYSLGKLSKQGTARLSQMRFKTVSSSATCQSAQFIMNNSKLSHAPQASHLTSMQPAGNM